MRCKTIVLWVLVNGMYHERLTEEDKKLSVLTGLIAATFPGVKYNSFADMLILLKGGVTQVLRKRFPELLSTNLEDISPDETTEITTFFPCDDYEWFDDPAWVSKFQELLATKVADPQ